MSVQIGWQSDVAPFKALWSVRQMSTDIFSVISRSRNHVFTFTPAFYLSCDGPKPVNIAWFFAILINYQLTCRKMMEKIKA